MKSDVIKNPGALRGWLVVDAGKLVGWRRLKRDAAKLQKEYDADPEGWLTSQVASGLELRSCQ